MTVISFYKVQCVRKLALAVGFDAQQQVKNFIDHGCPKKLINDLAELKRQLRIKKSVKQNPWLRQNPMLLH